MDLTRGTIPRQIITLSLPILGSSFIQMAYNLTDQLWLGRVGSDAVAAVGLAGFFVWLGMCLNTLVINSASICISQAFGKKDHRAIEIFAANSFYLGVILALFFFCVTRFFSAEMLGFFELEDASVVARGDAYLRAISWGYLFYFLNPIFTSCYTGLGRSKTPFYINSVGLLLNIVLDPLFILGIGPLERMEEMGAARATVISQAVVFMLFLIYINRERGFFAFATIYKLFNRSYMRELIKIGFPICAMAVIFAGISMTMARIIARFGTIPVAIESIGFQIEAITYMTIGAFATALTSFVGQNYGARELQRIGGGFKVTMLLSIGVGLFSSLLFLCCGDHLIALFLREPEAIEIGYNFLKILAVAQVFMGIDAVCVGAFNGLGKTVPPSVLNVALSGSRIPMALLISSEALLGLDGIWWSISITNVLKGVILLIWFRALYKKLMKEGVV